MQNTNHVKLQLERDLQSLEEKMRRRDEYISSVEQENVKLRHDLSLQKGVKRDYESFVSGLSVPVLSEYRPSSTTSQKRKDSSIIEKQIQVEEEARSKLQSRPKSHLSQNSADHLERKTPTEFVRRQESINRVEYNYKSFLALTEPLSHSKPSCESKTTPNLLPKEYE